MLTRALPNLKLFMTWHSGRKSNFLEMSDVMIYSPAQAVDRGEQVVICTGCVGEAGSSCDGIKCSAKA